MPAEYTITAVQGQQIIEALNRLSNEHFIHTALFHCPHVPITPSEPYASIYNAKGMPTPFTINNQRENSPYHTGKGMESYNDKEKVQYMTANYYAFITEITGRVKFWINLTN